MEWQPIETAPKYGTDVWLFIPTDEPKQAVGYFDDNGGEYQFWAYREQLVQDVQGLANPTHWMPLPEAPNEKIEATANGERQKGTEL